MRTIETDRAIVEIIAWPEDKPWQGRYKTSSQIERGICTLVLSPEVFHDEAKANMAYRRHWLLDTSLDEVYWPCSHSTAIPSFPSQLDGKIGLPWAYTRGILNSPS